MKTFRGALLATLLASAAIAQPPPVCLTGGVALPGSPTTIWDPAFSVIDTVGTSGTPVNLGRFSEALNHNQQENLITVTDRQVLGPAGRPTATLLDPAGVTSFVAANSVTTTPSTTRTLSVHVLAGPGHNGTSRMTLYAFTTLFRNVKVIPTATWQRISVEIPNTDAEAVVQVFFYPDEDTGTESVYFDQWQLEQGTLTAYEPTGTVIGIEEISRLVDTTSDGRTLIAWESSAVPGPQLSEVLGLPVLLAPSGDTHRLDLIGVPADTSHPNNGEDFAAIGGYTIAYVWRADGIGSQFGSFGRAESRSGPWQTVLRTNEPGSSGNTDFSILDPDAFTFAAGIGTDFHASVIVVEDNAQADHYIDGGATPADTQTIGVLGNQNTPGPGPHIWKIFGGADTTQKEIFLMALWNRELTVAEVAEVFVFFRTRPFGGLLPY